MKFSSFFLFFLFTLKKPRRPEEDFSEYRLDDDDPLEVKQAQLSKTNDSNNNATAVQVKANILTPRLASLSNEWKAFLPIT